MLKEIDPFTFFGTFNRGITPDNRRAILDGLRTHFGLTEPVPADFDGVPVLDNRNSWFIAFQAHREPDDVACLWKVFHLSRTEDPLESPAFLAAFDAARLVKQTGSKLTIGLFWTRPDYFLSLDSKLQRHLRLDLPSTRLTADRYRQAVHEARGKGQPFYELSEEAWTASQASGDGEEEGVGEPTARHKSWVFQANPTIFDIEGAIAALTRMRWTIRKYKDRIRKGDVVFFWMSGQRSGCVGRGVIVTDPQAMAELAEEQPFHRNSEEIGDTNATRVELEITHRCLPPISRVSLLDDPVLKNMQVLRIAQGTHFPLTEAEATELERRCRSSSSAVPGSSTIVNADEQPGPPKSFSGNSSITLGMPWSARTGC